MTEESLFAVAREMADPAERSAFLAEACGSDVELRARVESLLEADEQAGAFLQRPAVEAFTGPHTPAQGHHEEAPQAGEGVGSLIGPYKLLQKLGEGGMGAVWVAEQHQPVKRRVALKLIKPGMDSAQVLRRFEAERQALALMDHTNIAKVFDGGLTAEGRPYFAMELVHGVPITRYCDELNLSIRERLELFVPVCQAVQHAHTKGVIHRDVKPSNVLVCIQDGNPVPKVIDFGVAKALHQKLTEETLFTEFGALVGTLEYMSPEQAEMSPLGVDTRADVYSLGVLLYELLTGTTPLDRKRLRSAAYSEMVRLIKEEEPPKPSTRLTESKETLASLAAHRRTQPAQLTREVRGELDWIVMKCLEKDRRRRYETANGLARDLERFLHDEPVEACPPSRGYKLRKYARRYRTVLITAAAFVVLLFVATVVSTWQAWRARVAERAADEERADATAQRDRAMKAEGEAKQQRDAALAQQKRADEQAAVARGINQFLVADLLTQAEPEHNAPVDRVPLLEVLDQAAARVGERFRDQPLLEASLRGTLGDVYHGLADHAKADKQWSAALAIRRRMLGADHVETYRAMAKRGHVLMHLMQREESMGLLRPAAAGLTRALGPDHQDSLFANASLAYTYLNLGRPDEAITLCEQTLARTKTSLGSDQFVTLNWLMDCLAGAYLRANRLDKALPQAEQALEKTKAALGPDHPRTLISMKTLANVYTAAGESDRVLSLYEDVLEKTKGKFGPDHHQTLDVQWRLGVASYIARRLDKSIPLFVEILRRRQAKLGKDHPDTISTALNLAQNYRAAKRMDEAIVLFDEWLTRSREKLGPDHRHTQYGLSNLAPTLAQAKEFDRAALLYRELFEAQSRKRPVDDLQRANTLASLGLCLLNVGKPADAEPVLRECLAIREKNVPDDWRRFNTQSLLGSALLGLKKYADAEPLLVQGFEGMKQRQAKIPAVNRVGLTQAVVRLDDRFISSRPVAWSGDRDEADEGDVRTEVDESRTRPGRAGAAAASG